MKLTPDDKLQGLRHSKKYITDYQEYRQDQKV